MAQPVEYDSNGDGTVTAYPDPAHKPAHKVREPLLSEILTRVHKAKNTEDKEEILRQEDCMALRQILKWNFDPNIESDLPEGIPPYVENEAPEGTEHMLLRTEGDKLYNFIKGAQKHQATVRERMFIRLLEGLHKNEANLLCDVKDKKLTYNDKTKKGIKGLSKQVLMEAFGWDEDFKVKGV